MNLENLIEALTEIRRMAMEHPAFDAHCFEYRDIEGCEPGDSSDWTMVAILADDALKQDSRCCRRCGEVVNGELVDGLCALCTDGNL